MPKAADHVERLLKIAARASHLTGTATSHNIGHIRRIFKAIGTIDNHTARALHGYFLVSLVTNIEVFFRGAVTELINSGAPYFERIDPLIKDLKFDADSIRALLGRKITLGEVISLVPSFQSLDKICGIMSMLLGTPFLPAIATARDRWEVEVQQLPDRPIIENIENVAQSLSALFEMRHIIVHELPNDLGLTAQQIESFIDVTEQFLNASRWYISELIDPGAPLQQQPMNARAGQQAQDSNEEMQRLFSEFRDLIGERVQDLDRAQAAWVEYRDATSNFEGNEYIGGSIRPLIFYTSYKEITDQRITYLKSAIHSIHNDPRYG